MRHWTLHEALVYGKGSERPFLCPVHGDSRPSASVNVVKQKWYCYTCGARGGLTGEDALIEPDFEVMKSWFTAKMEESRVYPEAWLAQYTAGGVHDYWRERVGTRAAEHFKLGYDVESERLTYPLRNARGHVLGVVRRRVQGDEGPKYLYPRGVDVGRLLFNYSPEHRRAVVLVEGALDAIALWRVGIEAFAIYGSRLGPEQVRLIDCVDPEFVVTAFDNDEAGYRAHCDAERALRHRQVARLRWPLSWGKDVDELGEERLRKVVSSLECPGVSCVGSPTWDFGSRRAKQQQNQTTTSSMTTWRPSRLRIRPSGT